MIFSTVIDTKDLDPAARSLRLLANIGLVDAVNAAATSTFDESRRLMLSRVNLTEQYVRERMGIEPANSAQNPTATIIAFRRGGRRPAMRGVNLRQYAAVVQQQPNNWSNSGVATNSGRVFAVAQPQGHRKGGVGPNPARTNWLPNPRKSGAWLPFIARTGNPLLKIPVGMKQAGVSVEVERGQRKIISYAFMQRMPGGEILVMARDKGDNKGKGKIHSLASLAVWQMFKSNETMGRVIPFAQVELQRRVLGTVDEQISKVVNG